MVSVREADKIILESIMDFGTENIPFEAALGRVLAEDILADRDLPPFNRVTMDGIAIDFKAYAKGIRSFKIQGIIAAGEPPQDLIAEDYCLEIMTGALLPLGCDCIIPYEELEMDKGIARIKSESIKPGQNIHIQGKDKKKGQILAFANQEIQPSLIALAASVGQINLKVRKIPRVIILSTGDELVNPQTIPKNYQIRSSNNYNLKSSLSRFGIKADLIHLPDDPIVTEATLKNCLVQYNVILMSGGVSMGKFDYVPNALENLGVKPLFHKIQQRPGKPFWFGRKENNFVFAFPGNPVSTFLCFIRYFLPWLKASWKMTPKVYYAQLGEDLRFPFQLQYFLQVSLETSLQGEWIAKPIIGNGSGDFSGLVESNAFMELPLERNEFKKGEVFPVWPF